MPTGSAVRRYTPSASLTSTRVKPVAGFFADCRRVWRIPAARGCLFALAALRGLVAATEQPASRLCTACFDGKYPIELPGESALGKNVIEHMLANAARDVELGDLAADEVPVDR